MKFFQRMMPGAAILPKAEIQPFTVKVFKKNYLFLTFFVVKLLLDLVNPLFPELYRQYPLLQYYQISKNCSDNFIYKED